MQFVVRPWVPHIKPERVTSRHHAETDKIYLYANKKKKENTNLHSQFGSLDHVKFFWHVTLGLPYSLSVL